MNFTFVFTSIVKYLIQFCNTNRSLYDASKKQFVNYVGSIIIFITFKKLNLTNLNCVSILLIQI